MSASGTLRSALALATVLILSTSAHAQSFRAYLASNGNDANPCSLASPCRLLPAALNAVVSGGEIWMLDSANFNTSTVTIGKSVSILAVPGAVGSALAIGGPAIVIIAPGLNVSLRNLVIAPLPSSGATYGVYMTGASTLTIESSVLANLPNVAVYVTGTGKVRIANSTLRNNGSYAVRLNNGAQAEISGSQILGNVSGVLAYGGAASTTTTASVSDSVVSGGASGVFAYANTSGATARVLVSRCTIEGADIALDSETTGVGTANLAVSGSTIVNNAYAWVQSGVGSVIRSLVNNHITDNINVPVGFLTGTALQ